MPVFEIFEKSNCYIYLKTKHVQSVVSVCFSYALRYLFSFESVNLPAPDMVRKVVLAFISKGLQTCVFMSFKERKGRDPTENLF